jgi:hypothetical protein
MSTQTSFGIALIAGLAATGLGACLCGVLASAESPNATYVFLAGAGFLCDSGDSAPCPAVVRSADGASYEISGAGTFATQSKSVTAAGTYTRKSSGGNVHETGVWVAIELLSFESYGIAPGALTREGRALGSPPFGPMRPRMFSGSMPTGGLAVFRVRLLPMWGVSRTATLEVNCALGKVPDERQTEGIRLKLERGGDFDQEISGRTMFVLVRPSGSPAPNSPASPGETYPTPATARP